MQARLGVQASPTHTWNVSSPPKRTLFSQDNGAVALERGVRGAWKEACQLHLSYRCTQCDIKDPKEATYQHVLETKPHIVRPVCKGLQALMFLKEMLKI